LPANLVGQRLDDRQTLQDVTVCVVIRPPMRIAHRKLLRRSTRQWRGLCRVLGQARPRPGGQAEKQDEEAGHLNRRRLSVLNETGHGIDRVTASDPAISRIEIARGELFSVLSVVRARRANKGAGSDMSDIFIIEVGSRAAGIVVRNPGGYCFFAASHRFNQMEGQLFRNAREAERAAIRLANGDLKRVA